MRIKSLNDIGYSIVATADSGYTIAASARSDDGDVQGLHGAVAGHGSEDFWILKIDSIGSIQWQKCFVGSESEVPNQIIRTKDGGYMVVGTAKSSDYDVTGYHYSGSLWDDVWILKLDSLGNMQWQKCLGGFDVDICRKVIQLEDSSYLALCYTYSTDGDLVANPPVGNIDVWLVRIDQAGNILWQQCLGGSNADAAYDFEQTSDGGIVFTGLSDSNDGDVSGNHGDFDVWVVKLAPLPDSIAAHVNPIADFAAHQSRASNTLGLSFYCNGNENVSIQLLDLTGRVLLQQRQSVSTGFNKKQVQTGNISTGVYMVRLATDAGAVVKKLMVQ